MDPPKVAMAQRAAISWFAATQASKIMRDGTVPNWFHGIISRRDAEEMLKNKSLGCFLIRIGESRIGFSLSYRGIDRCRHFMIDVTTDGLYNISGDLNFHHTLHNLVTFHTRVPIVPFNEYLTVPCGQVSRDSAGYDEVCLLVPTTKKQTSPTPHSHSSAGISSPITSHSTFNPLKQVAISPPVPLKGHSSRMSPPPLPHRGVTDWKPVPEPKARTDGPTPLSGRVLVKRLYPSIQPTAISMEQQPTPGATVSGPQSPLLQNTQHSNPETRIGDMHISSEQTVSHSKSELKHQAASNVYGRYPIPIQGQLTDHTAPDVLISRSHGQPVSHLPALFNQSYSKTTQPVLAEPVRGCELLTDCAEGQRGEHFDLPAEYMTPPPYAPGYQAS